MIKNQMEMSIMNVEDKLGVLNRHRKDTSLKQEVRFDIGRYQSLRIMGHYLFNSEINNLDSQMCSATFQLKFCPINTLNNKQNID